jgi:hypothetical protein
MTIVFAVKKNAPAKESKEHNGNCDHCFCRGNGSQLQQPLRGICFTSRLAHGPPFGLAETVRW